MKRIIIVGGGGGGMELATRPGRKPGKKKRAEIILIDRPMGNLGKGRMFVAGRVARMVSMSLYRMHQFAMHDWSNTVLIVIVDRLQKAIRPTIKLHS